MKIAQFQFSLFGINSYIVFDPTSKKCIIIDPGMIAEEEEKAIENFINRENLEVIAIVNTHGHIDHSVGNKWSVERFNAPLYAHKDDRFLTEGVQQQAQMFGINRTVFPVEASSELKDGDVIKIGNGELHVLHIPGHSPGSIVLYDKEDGFVVAGDVLFQGSIGRTDLPGGSMPQLLEGIKSKLLTLPDSTIVYPGHGPATTIAAERIHNPFLMV